MIDFIEINTLFNIDKGSLQSTKCTEGEYDFITASSEWKTHNEYTHDQEALVVAVSASGSLGRVHYVKGKFISSDLCFILTPKSKEHPVDLSFYYYIFRSIRDDLVKSTATGTSKLAINKTNFGNYKVPYVDITKQKKFKSKLINVAERKEKLTESNEIQLNLIQTLRQQILQDAITGKLSEKWRKETTNIEPADVLLEKIKAEKEKLMKEGKIRKQKKLPPINDNETPFELPDGWVWCRLEDVGLLERGKSKHRPRNDESLFVDGIYPFVQTGDVARSKNNNYQIVTYDKCYNEKGLKQSRIWNKGTLCITIAANIAETGFLNIDACFPDSVVGFTSLIGTEIPKYVRLFIDVMQSEIEKFAPATAQKNINLGILNQLVFPLPPIDEL